MLEAQPRHQPTAHPPGDPAEGGLQPQKCASTACSSQDHREDFPRDLSGPEYLVISAGVGSREGLPSAGVVSAQSLASQEHFLNFPGLSPGAKSSWLLVIAASHITHVKTVIYLLDSEHAVSEDCWTLHAAPSFFN